MTATQGVIVENGAGNTATTKPKKVAIIKNLITLKLVLFIFYGALGCLFPFLSMHMLDVGLNRSESRIISIVAPLVSLIGPLIVAPIADRLTTRKGATGKHLRIIAAITMILGAILYAILLCVPNLERFEEKRPLVGFSCDPSGALLLQERIEEQRTCYYWEKARVGKFVLTNCSYTCQTPTNFEKLYKPWEGSPYPPTEASTETESEGDYDETVYNESTEKTPLKVTDHQGKRGVLENPRVEPPHLCINRGESETQLCHAFTEPSQHLELSVKLRGAINKENATHSAEWCKYPLDGFTCNIPQDQIVYMKATRTNCEPAVECEMYNPYNSEDSILGETLLIGDPDLTFWFYLAIRCFADIFPCATVAILNAIIIIATRETSSGRGDVGHQLVWGAVGFALFAPILGAIGPHSTQYLIPFLVFLVMSLIGALLLLAAKDMPLSPPEWWWHTKSGMVAIPMSAIRKYGPETAALVFVTFLLGVFWSVIDTYQSWFLKDLIGEIYESNVLSTLTLTVGALSAVPFLWYAERIVDYCGHTNLLITSFVFYVLRFIVMAQLNQAWFVLLMEAIEPLTLGLTWITIILYMRHIIPRRLTATGQALPVIAHFCVGKAIGAILGLTHDFNDINSFRSTYLIMSVVSLFIAVIYFLLYHLVFGPRCGAKPQPPPEGVLHGARPTNGNLASNPNGNYTPLRVYHNGRAKKGHFRY
jgi:hypothetical protein